jgi:predicted amidophosphoribosyltransferase
MKYLYKINSGFDGFTPAKLPERMVRKRLELVWKKYLDDVEKGDEIWVYFYGRHQFEPGVYAKGVAADVLYDKGYVVLHVNQSATAAPLTDHADTAKIAAVVAVRYQQVFVLPESLGAKPVCDMQTTATSCLARRCGSCPTWARLPRINRRVLQTPQRLAEYVDRYVPAYWVTPPRNFLYKNHRSVRPSIQMSSELFFRFKFGEAALAFPLSLGMQRALGKAHTPEFDAIVPVPLSPDKAKKGELHRTLALATELGKLLGIPVREWLELSGPISKRKLGLPPKQFEAAYIKKLRVTGRVSRSNSLLLIDDVCTNGSTLRVCADAIRAANPDCRVTAVTAGQMTVKQAVADPTALLSP